MSLLRFVANQDMTNQIIGKSITLNVSGERRERTLGAWCRVFLAGTYEGASQIVSDVLNRLAGWTLADLQSARMNTLIKVDDPKYAERAQAMLKAIDEEMARRSPEVPAAMPKKPVSKKHVRSASEQSRRDSSTSKVTRISFNSEGWTRPTGEAAEQESNGTYNADNRFGHEDWLFRNEWLLDGWRYAFLQGVNKSHAKLVRDSTPFDVTLFTVHPDKTRSYVAHISEMECLSDEQANDALAAFKAQGWVDDTMIGDVGAVGGNKNALGNPEWARHLLNVRFRLDRVQRLDQLVEEDDPVMHLHRYMLYGDSQIGDGNWIAPTRRRGRVGQFEAPTQGPYTRAAVGPVACTPEHARMQAILLAELRTEHSDAEIVCEEDFVDVSVRSEETRVLYEIKTDLSPTTVLRQAIGQLLEYGHHGKAQTRHRLRFVAVGRNPLSAQDQAYLELLRSSYGLPIEYRLVPL